MKQNIEHIVYLIGILLLGVFYEPIKSALGRGIWFLVGAIVMLIALRGVAVLVKRMAGRKRQT